MIVDFSTKLIYSVLYKLLVVFAMLPARLLDAIMAWLCWNKAIAPLLEVNNIAYWQALLIVWTLHVIFVPIPDLPSDEQIHRV